MLRVLLVEDNGDYRKAFKENLFKHIPSMVVDEAVDGEEALQKMKATPPHLVFIDMSLPGMNGLQLTQKIKKDFPKIRIVIVTGYDLPEYRQASLQCGVDSFFVKESPRWDEVEALVKSIGEVPSDW